MENNGEYQSQQSSLADLQTRRPRLLARLRGNVILWLLLVLPMGILNEPQLHAQVATADVLGTVADQTGAVLQGANITITNLGTGIKATTKSNEAGDYVFTLLTPGHYMLTI